MSDACEFAPSRRGLLLGAAVATGAIAASSVVGSASASQRTAAAWKSARLTGIVQSGAGAGAGVRRMSHARVTVFACGSGALSVIGTAKADGSGAFTVRLIETDATVMHVVAGCGQGVVFSAIVTDARDEIVVNEMTTVATGFAFAQFLAGGAIVGTKRQLSIAAGMYANLVDTTTGKPSRVMTSAPNGDQTNSLRSLGSLANVLARFARRRGGPSLRAFYEFVTPPGARTATNMAQAMSCIARFPQANVNRIFRLAGSASVYAPALRRKPDAWTIAVKVNDTGSPDHLFGGPANIAFDERGYAWVTNNVDQGGPDSSRFNVVLRPDGRPADGTRNTPTSPLTAGGILGAGFGVAAAPNGTVWMGNFGWGGKSEQPSASGVGSLVHFASDGTALSGRRGIQGGPVRAQGIAVDARGNVWIASYGNDRIYVFPHGNAAASVYLQLPDKACPFDIQLASDGTAWLSCSGGLQSNANSHIGRYSFDGTRITEIWSQAFGHSLKGMGIDSLGNAWIASGGDSCVYLFAPDGTHVGTYDGGGIDSPWSVEIDGDDNVWVANFGPEKFNTNYRNASITRLAGANPATRPAGLSTGDPISPATGYTLPTAGAPVTLADGTPLYGKGRPDAFTPLQRMTAVRIDAAGNAWAINNWKPSFDVDLKNPGGDGIAIFVGVAPPRR